jgi:2-keto-4-pentenoate hydratase/2-oxohepta-3-ene-1,7-dioic acid hydratase in catechol pathway
MPDLPDIALGRFANGGGPFTGVVASGRVAPVADLLPHWTDSGIEGLLAGWDDHVAALRERVAADPAALRHDETTLRRLAPVTPRQLLGAGMNYRKHVIDLMVDSGINTRDEAAAIMDERARSGTPLVFAGLPSAICGPDDEIRLRADSDTSDWELELAAVIARTPRDVSRDEALDYVAGWTIVNDLTARNFVPRTDAGPVSVDWLRSKCAPTYKPTGPYVVPAACVGDPQDLRIILKLNGETMQDESTADMIFGAAALISYLSHEVTLLPGDLVMTGSPAGNGTHHNRFLRDGDQIEATITGLGVQRNRCVA